MAADPQELLAAVVARTDEIVTALGEHDLEAPSALPGWSRLTIACHLRYGAAALARMTEQAVAGEPTAYYPGGRDREREATLRPLPGESPGDVVASLAHEGARLQARWASLAAGQWRTAVVESADDPDLGTLPLASLLLLRLTEVEVHGTDLEIGLADWSRPFVEAALPFRLDRLALRRPVEVDDGAWLLRASDGPTWLVTVRGTSVESRPADPADAAAATIEGTSRDLLALLLGRPPREPLRFAGADDVARSFSATFPGP